jgi:RHS repeat-associated protein
VRTSTVNDEWGGEISALVNYYSYPYAHCGNGPDNNGNLLMSQTIINSVYFEDRYSYDSLNRLSDVNEYLNGSTFSGKQEYAYDRWGNRTLKPGASLGTYKEFTVNTANNRLGVPAGQSGAMDYDLAGNLTNDTYTGAGNRTYDAENKITSAWGGLNQAQLYGYDASGQRIKRTVNGVTTWQVYGFANELLAEYPANGAATSPQKEYGYRNGELLISASASAGSRVNFASSTNGATATAQNYTQDGVFAGYHFYPSSAIDGQRYGHLIAGGGDINGFWRDEHGLPSWLEVNFNGSKTIEEIDVFAVPECPACLNQADPSPTQTFSQYGVTGFEVQYWTGSSWATVPGGSISGNNLVWRKLTFAPITTSKIRVLVTAAATDGVARINEIEAWTTSPNNNATVNWLVSDHLGTPRMIIDQTGTLANVKRHDYLPFGEELFAPAGGRTGPLGYVAGDGVRQQFTSKERDVETGLDYFQARYYSSVSGRFISADEPFADQYQQDPQTWNLYAYTSNNPLVRVDDDGKRWFYKDIYDEHGNRINRLVQWVDANEDGTYTSPGEGYVEFIPTKESRHLWTCSDGTWSACNKVAKLGEASDGSPTVKELWTGRVESANDHLVGALLAARVLLGIRSAGAAFNAWRAEREARRAAELWKNRGEIKIQPSQQKKLSDFFGGGPQGARDRMNNFQVPEGLTRETLEKYAEIARRTINAGKDKSGTQAERLKLVERALKEMKK